MQPRIRTVKPDICRHDALYDAEVESGLPLRFAFVGMLMVADREGRFVWKPRQIKTVVLPFDQLDFENVLDALAAHGFIVKYEVAGAFYGVIPTFLKHQHVNHREAKSELPPPPDDAMHMHAHACTGTHGQDDETPMHARGEWNRKELNRKEREDRHTQDQRGEPRAVQHDPSPGDEHYAGPSRAGEIALLLRKHGILGATPANPIVQSWANDSRVTDDVLIAAAEIAIANKAQRPGPRYLAPVIDGILNPPPPKTRQPRDDWFRSNEGMNRKAAELGMKARPGENADDFKARMSAEITRRANGHGGHA